MTKRAPGLRCCELLEAQLKLAGQSARQRTGSLEHPNGVASKR